MSYSGILHHSAKGGVIGSCRQLLIDAQHSLLIDYGLFQSTETSANGRSGVDRLAIESPLDTVKALIATHARIDHAGPIPFGIKRR
ncbi:hypothetical protein [Pseudomonas cavernae]|uniref:hypothetical protein n=1 Tax=Pseudomonas cavernae TaxID=2320867 RepID=UPI0015AF7FFA|nr:hypothetical protein [Pseudomonas cavernae]